MNIYLDIDGVLLVNDSNAASHADELLQTVINKYPESTYWLTTHCWNGENRTIKVLEPHLKPETISLLDNVKPTTWKVMKTEGINFSEPFLWLDDDLWAEEEAALKANQALNNFIMVDLYKNPNQLKEISIIL